MAITSSTVPDDVGLRRVTGRGRVRTLAVHLRRVVDSACFDSFVYGRISRADAKIGCGVKDQIEIIG